MLIDPPCDKCNGACCKGHEEYSVMLTDQEKCDYPEAIEFDEGCGKITVLPRVNGRCMHLSEDDKCNIYDKRPSLCRSFNCVSLYTISGENCFFMEDRPEVVVLIQNLKIDKNQQI